ncbi:hypothetical protein L873DRAFT_1848496 [Choiromyces venosus 120613-1]|uniref:Branchpoint-bridging protein n=1 Tax=Choiromyces venosus 120613-1 TaxID=1336337 RepID=A0A3N4J3G4_9PEZI|nr:hypothetical protein L873DRAFT_1848496 [Choiromyces venosus 120613-1]
MSLDDTDMYALKVHIKEITQKLSKNLVVPNDKRPLSPDPIYDVNGRRTNIREARYREHLEAERHDLVAPPSHYRKPVAKHEKVYVPVGDYPEINFIGLLIGPRGHSLKRIEKESGVKVAIRGKGSIKEGKGGSDLALASDQDENLHCLIISPNPDLILKAKKMMKETPVPTNILGGEIGYHRYDCAKETNYTAGVICREFMRDVLGSDKTTVGEIANPPTGPRYGNNTSGMGYRSKPWEGPKAEGDPIHPWSKSQSGRGSDEGPRGIGQNKGNMNSRTPVPSNGLHENIGSRERDSRAEMQSRANRDLSPQKNTRGYTGSSGAHGYNRDNRSARNSLHDFQDCVTSNKHNGSQTSRPWDKDNSKAYPLAPGHTGFQGTVGQRASNGFGPWSHPPPPPIQAPPRSPPPPPFEPPADGFHPRRWN